MKLYLVRHGRTNSNINHKLIGQGSNIDLDSVGIMQAKQLKEKIKDIKFDICYTSPLIRAFSTAMILVGDRTQIKSDPRIMERYLGELEGKDSELYDIDKYYDYKLNSDDLGVEKIQDLYTRCNDFINYLKENYNKDSKILIVSHYGIIKTLYHIINESDVNSKLDDIIVENCCFKEYEI